MRPGIIIGLTASYNLRYAAVAAAIAFHAISGRRHISAWKKCLYQFSATI